MELEAQRKDEERKEDEEDTEEPKGFTTQETARGFSLLVEAWLVFEVQNLNREWYCGSHSERNSVLPAAVLDHSTFRATVR